MIIFENAGELDVRAIKTFGVNSKDDKESAIGYFGTGLKYAIAILLRENHKINIITGGVEYKFGVNRSKIRNDEFDIVTMNGEDLGFTTQLGKNWELWQAFRELYSNMLDEGGLAVSAVAVPSNSIKTFVMVTGEGIEQCFRDKDQYFLPSDRAPKHRYKDVDGFTKLNQDQVHGTVYYKGVRVMQTRLAALFDYNHHTGLTLTEDRTISDIWSTSYHAARLVVTSTDKTFIKQVVTASDLTYEGNFRFDGIYGISDGQMETFLDVVGDLRKKYKDTGVNNSAIALHKGRRNVPHVMPSVSCRLNSIETQQLKKAKTFCKDILGLDLDEYRLIVAKDLGKSGNLGHADIENGIMYISKQCFAGGTKRVATALLEEYTHCKHEVYDETIEQKWVYLNQILSLGERLAGEPL